MQQTAAADVDNGLCNTKVVYVQQVAEELYHDAVESGLPLKTPLAHGILGVPQGKTSVFRLEINVWFPQVLLSHAVSPIGCLLAHCHCRLSG